MKQKLLLVAALLVVLNAFVKAQAPQLVKITPPSPNAAAFQKYGDIPVSPYTGVPNISIPIYTVKFRDVTIPISISYHASGIKVSEEASQVGLGWALNAGGSISRNIIGDDDFNGWVYFNNYANDLEDLTYNHGPTNFIVQGCRLPRFNRNIAQNSTLDTIDLTNQLNASPAYDFQPDQYFYNFLGNSGKFTLKRNRQAALQKAEKIEITCLDSSGNAFQARDLNGFIYDFAKYETNNENGQYRRTAWYLTKVTSPVGNSVSYKYSSITDRRVTTLGTYSETRDDYATPGVFPKGVFNTATLDPQQGIAPSKVYSFVQLDTIDFNSGIVRFFYSDRQDIAGDKMLDSVSIYSKDAQGKVSTLPLKTVVLGHGYFDYGAIDNDFSSDTSYCSKRLKLNYVVEKGYYGGTLVMGSPYKFSYYEGGALRLPSKNSFAKDHWGYYNGRMLNNSLIPSVVPITSADEVTFRLGGQGPERDPNADVMHAFSLASIQYPTGGSTEFQYEANDFDEQVSQENDKSYFGKGYSLVEQSQILNYDNIAKRFTTKDTLDLRNQYLFTNKNTGQAESYKVHMLARFRFSGTINCSQVFPYNSIYFDIYDSTGTNLLITKDIANFISCTGTESNNCMICQSQAGVISYNTDLGLQPGRYIIRFYASSAYNTALQDVAWTFKYYTKQEVPAANSSGQTFITGGGLRIKKIIDHDSLSAANDKVKRFNYHYFADKNKDGTPEEYSYGKRMSRPNYAFFLLTNERVQPDCAQVDPCNEYYFFSSHLMRSSDSNNPLNGSAGGAVVGYSQVEVLEGDQGQNGKTVYEYTNQPDLVLPYNDPINNLPMRPPYGASIPEQLNGSLIRQAEYASNGAILKEVRNAYSSTIDNNNTIYGMETRPYQKYYTTLTSPISRSQDVTLPCERHLISYWHQKAVWNYLSSTDEKIFSPTDQSKYEQQITTYHYDDTAHLLPTRVTVTSSKGETIVTKITYPLSYTTSSAADALTQGVQNLKNKHIITTPVEKFVQKTSSDGSNARVTTGVITSYNASLPLPAVAYTTQALSPLTNYVQLNINSSGAIMDSRYKPIVYFDAYDASGNILQQHKENDINHSYIWGYQKQYPIAEVVGAKYNEIAHESYEEGGTWNSITYDSTRSHTGRQSAKIVNTSTTGAEKTCLAKNWMQVSFTAPTKFKFSGWVYSDGPSADLYLLMKRAGETGYSTYNTYVRTTEIGKWTFIEKEYTVPADVTQMLLRIDANTTGNVWFDDVRLHPSTAEMTTYTYDPLIGMTSQTDINNRATYYEYDSFGRLMLMRDMFGNVIKTINYHYRDPLIVCVNRFK